MKRILLAASRLMTKSKDTALSPEASATIVQVLKIASTVNVPFCQTACNTIIAFIQMREAAGTNDRQWKMLLDVIKIYASRISEFVKAISEGHPPDYFAVSDDLRAKIAREAVQEFETHISQTKAKIDVRLGTGKIKKILAATVVQEEITECRQMIATAHERLNDRILNILAISSTGAPVPPGPSESAPEETEYDIPGARPLRGQDMEILEDVDMATVVQDSFWTNIVRVEVQNKVRIAKVYDTSDGGKEKFKKDLQFFAKCWSPNIVRISGYSSRSQVPFVIFTAASLLPIAKHWSLILALSLYHAQRPGADRSCVKPFWNHYINLSAQMEMATRYLFTFVNRRNVDHLLQLYAALHDAALDPNGKLIVAPLTENSTRKTDTSSGSRDSLKERAIHPSRHRKMIAGDRPFYSQDPVIQTWPIGKESFVSLHQRWPDQVYLEPWYHPTISVGDLVRFSLLRDFQVLANAKAFTGPIRFHPPGQPTSQMHVYRCEIDGYGEGKRRSRLSPRITWFSDVDNNSIDLDALWRFFVREQTEAPIKEDAFKPRMIYFASVVTAIQYFVGPEEPAMLSPSHHSGPSPNLYIYFSPQNEYISTRWSFHPEPPTEAEAAEEASLLSTFPCPKFSSEPKSWVTEYLHFDYKEEEEEEEEEEMKKRNWEKRKNAMRRMRRIERHLLGSLGRPKYLYRLY